MYNNMSSFDFNKFFAAIILAIVVLVIIGKVGDKILNIDGTGPK